MPRVPQKYHSLLCWAEPLGRLLSAAPLTPKQHTHGRIRAVLDSGTRDRPCRRVFHPSSYEHRPDGARLAFFLHTYTSVCFQAVVTHDKERLTPLVLFLYIATWWQRGCAPSGHHLTYVRVRRSDALSTTATAEYLCIAIYLQAASPKNPLVVCTTY